MSFIERKVPPYFYRKSNLTLLVAFTAAFALIFINIYHPFNSTEWYDISKFEYFLYSSLLILTGIMIVVITRTFMFYYTKKRALTYWEYAIFIFCDVLFMSLLYTFISYTLEEKRDFWEVFNASAKNTFLVLLLPYLICHLYFAWKEKSRLLSTIKENKTQSDAPSSDIITFHDDKGEMKFSIKKENLLYLESADNYVSIWYISKAGVSTYLLRNTLKNLEAQFASTNIIRCHRSYIVNCDQVKLARKGRAGLTLDLGIEKVPEIPVSKSYGETISEWLMSSMR